MTLWEITSYADALARERDRQLARADLRARHGRRWRSRTDRRTRVLLKLGEFAPADSNPALSPAPAPVAEGELPAAPVALAAERKPAARRRGPKQGAGPKPGRRSLDDVLADARTATASWPAEHLTADRIRQAVNCGAAHARAARDALRAERDGQAGAVEAVAA
jgi:hypothetical protein